MNRLLSWSALSLAFLAGFVFGLVMGMIVVVGALMGGMG
jgi:hypothetical protein